MTESNTKSHILNRISRFDLLILLIVIILVIMIALITLLGQTKNDNTYHIAFIRTGGANVNNLWMVNPETGEEEQLTSERLGINQYDVSADGNFIAYSVRDFQTNTVDIYSLNLLTNERTQLTNCLEESSICDNPRWRPDGLMIAYERSLVNGRSTRIWLLDLKQSPTRTFSLLNDPEFGGDSPTWSDDGDKLAFYARGLTGIVVYDFASTLSQDTELAFIPTSYGLVGEFSPDSTQMIFPELVTVGPLVHSNLQIATLNQGNLQFEILTPLDDDAFDRADSWHPDGTTLAMTRRNLSGEAVTQGFQVYLMDMFTREITPLVFDADYDHGRTHWRPDGEVLLLQRTPIQMGIGRNFSEDSQIWLYDMATNDLRLITTRAFQPRWIP